MAVVEKYVKLKRSGHSYKGKCPFHDEKTPSFSVTEGKGIYKCFGCGEGGDAVNFIMKMEGLDFIEAIRHLAGMLRIIINEEKAETPKNYTPPNAVIPSIWKAKRHIRKEERAIVCFSDDILDELQESGRNNVVLVKQWGSNQAQLLAKYTNDITIICRDRTKKAIPITGHSSAAKPVYKGCHYAQRRSPTLGIIYRSALPPYNENTISMYQNYLANT
ncbi:CHC2 zinc finger domain-containing protein [Fodinibius sp.]|uniref:CHC2 zinc finger domain-containing protein n=1 Tax=Fodinibius sp. TaxID=1872440 RepID=UPI002ACE129C|nr:CHC2 zinc finger domain-containing protein [Fodinibius sp.]MDZ7658006.1 CHC2 zinc finger domain-containing protein [Fodinibius sp.]